MRYEQFEEVIKGTIAAKDFNLHCMELVRINMKHRRKFIEALHLGFALDYLLNVLLAAPDQGKILEELMKAKETNEH